jgi:hypothetical protein
MKILHDAHVIVAPAELSRDWAAGIPFGIEALPLLILLRMRILFFASSILSFFTKENYL